MKIHGFVANKFTAFDNIRLGFSEGINVLIGENGTGKTHIMKALYAMTASSGNHSLSTPKQKMQNVFKPNSIGRLVHRTIGNAKGSVETIISLGEDGDKEKSLKFEVTNKGSVNLSPKRWVGLHSDQVTFIPVKDMLANAPNFRSLYNNKDLFFEEVYADIIDKALLPATRGPHSKECNALLEKLRIAMDGRVVAKGNDMFYLKNNRGELEFSLLAEGYRKLGLLYTLIVNDTLAKGNILFWDEPESNLNPKLSRAVVEVLLELQRMGVQIFISTHDYFLLKELELATTGDDIVKYFVLSRDSGSGKIVCKETTSYDEIVPNAIDDTVNSILDMEIARDFN